MIVVDTNVIAAFHLRSGSTPTAYDIMRADPDWAAPILWRSEFRNVLVNHLRCGLLSLDRAFRLMAAAESLMGGNEHNVASAAVLDLAAASGCTAYDGEFVALAGALGVPLVTLDRKLVRAFPEVAILPEPFLRA